MWAPGSMWFVLKLVWLGKLGYNVTYPRKYIKSIRNFFHDACYPTNELVNRQQLTIHLTPHFVPTAKNAI